MTSRRLGYSAQGGQAMQPNAPLPATQLAAPQPPAVGQRGRWVKLGQVGIDSATMAIADPVLMNSSPCYKVEFMAGLGDGSYDIWAWIVDYSGDAGDRIAQVVVTLIDESALEQWNAG